MKTGQFVRKLLGEDKYARLRRHDEKQWDTVSSGAGTPEVEVKFVLEQAIKGREGE
jgi:hypothetical protein